jgi:hypothetical protein
VLARLNAGHIHLRAEILTEDGSQHRRGSKSFEPGDTQGPGQLAVELLDGASPELAALFTCAS